MTILSSSIVVASVDQTSCELSGETVILDFTRGGYYGLNDIGTVIWQQLKQPRTVGELCDAVIRQYDVDRAVCEQDVIRLLERLHAERLIEVRPDPAT